MRISPFITRIHCRWLAPALYFWAAVMTPLSGLHVEEVSLHPAIFTAEHSTEPQQSEIIDMIHALLAVHFDNKTDCAVSSTADSPGIKTQKNTALSKLTKKIRQQADTAAGAPQPGRFPLSSRDPLLAAVSESPAVGFFSCFSGNSPPPSFA